MKKFIREVTPYAKLYRDSKTGIAWIDDDSTGLRYTVHPYIDRTGSIKGMKQQHFWGKDDKVVTAAGYHYNISRFWCDKNEPFDELLSHECMCYSCNARREREGGKS